MITSKDFVSGIKNCKDLGKVMDEIEIPCTLGQMIAPEGMSIMPSLDKQSGSVMFISIPAFKLRYLLREVLDNIKEDYFPSEVKEHMDGFLKDLNDPHNTEQELLSDFNVTLSLENFSKFNYAVVSLVENGTITKWMFPQSIVDEAESADFNFGDKSEEEKLRLMRFLSLWGKSTGMSEVSSDLIDNLNRHCEVVQVGNNPYSERYDLVNFEIRSLHSFKELIKRIHKSIGLSEMREYEAMFQDLITEEESPADKIDNAIMSFNPEAAKVFNKILNEYNDLTT